MPPATTTLVDRLLNHLAAAGLGRLPGDQGAGARPWPPPIWRNPEGGAPEPGTKKGNEADDGLVLGAYYAGQIPIPPGGGYSRRETIDIHLRSKAVPRILTHADLLRAELAPHPYGVRYDWVMNGQQIIECRQWRGLQPLAGPGSEGQGFTYVVGYLFETLI